MDGAPSTPATLPAWQNRIGYVPQDVFLVDGTVAENIALGPRRAGPAPRSSARRGSPARTTSSPPCPRATTRAVGERGARLSGGQRQRIGIARALYHDPDVIVFDEATSALDDETEGAVMRALRALAGRRTLILIAHRLTTLEGADAVHVLEAGRLVASGPPEAVTAASRGGGVRSRPDEARPHRPPSPFAPRPAHPLPRLSEDQRGESR